VIGFPQSRIFFPQFPQRPALVFRSSKFFFHTAEIAKKKLFGPLAFAKSWTYIAHHFRVGRSMADVNGAKGSFEALWDSKRTQRGCSFADVNALRGGREARVLERMSVRMPFGGC
jgi:hypothetical protein